MMCCTTLADAELIAERVDQAIFATNSPNTRRPDVRATPRRSDGRYTRDPRDFTPMELGAVAGAAEQKPAKSVECWRCGKKGHVQNQCRVRLPDHPVSYPKPPPRGRANNMDQGKQAGNGGRSGQVAGGPMKTPNASNF